MKLLALLLCTALVNANRMDEVLDDWSKVAFAKSFIVVGRSFRSCVAAFAPGNKQLEHVSEEYANKLDVCAEALWKALNKADVSPIN